MSIWDFMSEFKWTSLPCDDVLGGGGGGGPVAGLLTQTPALGGQRGQRGGFCLFLCISRQISPNIRERGRQS